MKEFIQAVINAYLNRKNEKHEVFLKSDDYPSHDKLIEKINEKNKLQRMLEVSNPLLQQLILWCVDNHKLPVRLDEIKYFNRYIKENDNGDLYLEERDIKNSNLLALTFIFLTAISFVSAQLFMIAKWYIFSYGALAVSFLMLFSLILVALIPRKKDAESMKKLIQEYNKQNKENS